MNASSRDNLHAALSQSPLAAHADQMVSLALPSIRIRTQRALVGPGESRFGGDPDLPDDLEWPTRDGEPMHLLAQLNFSEILPNQSDRPLPKSGSLCFFYHDPEGGVWGFDPKDRAGWSIVHFESDLRLRRRATPAQISPFPECRLAFEVEWMLPDLQSLDFPDDLRTYLKSDEVRFDQFVDWCDKMDFAINQHRMLGYSQPNQEGDMRLECQLVSNGLYCGDGSGYIDPRADALAAGASDWRLLLQIDTDDTEGSGPGWGWVDCGRLYLMIRNEDLRAQTFDRSWLILQCY